MYLYVHTYFKIKNEKTNIQKLNSFVVYLPTTYILYRDNMYNTTVVFFVKHYFLIKSKNKFFLVNVL